jgi:hypothetical protein
MFTPTTENKIPEQPMQMVLIICDDYSRHKILARFAPNIKRRIMSYKVVYRA